MVVYFNNLDYFLRNVPYVVKNGNDSIIPNYVLVHAFICFMKDVLFTLNFIVYSPYFYSSDHIPSFYMLITLC